MIALSRREPAAIILSATREGSESQANFGDFGNSRSKTKI
jgi:hypothetical protein